MKAALAALVVLGCGRHTAEPVKPVVVVEDDAATIRSVAAAYAAWGKVDDQSRAAPAMCAAPVPPSTLHRSAAADGPHQEKLYYLYASDRAAYLNQRAGVGFPIGFRIVKESFAAEGGAPTGLFVMAKVGTTASDAGWIYGTTRRDGDERRPCRVVHGLSPGRTG